MHSSGATAISGGMAPAFLSMPGHLRHPHDLQGHQIASFNGHGLPIHPAFQFQTYPFYPTGLLAAIRPPGSSAIQKSSLRDTVSTKSSGSKSFTIDAILASDKDDDVSSREGTPEVDPDEKEAVVAAGAHAQDASRPPPLVGTRRPEVMNPFSGHAQGLAHCPAAAIRYAHFNPGNRPEKKHGHVTGNTWKGKSKRVRTIFTPEQLERLEAEFERQQYMVGTERYYLAASLNLTEAQVKVWFQNRRIKWRKQNLEQQHAKMAQFDLFTPEEGSDSDGDIGDRKYDDGRGDHVTTQDGEVMAEVTNRNASFDSGISVDRSKLNEETNRCDHVTGSVTRINDLDKVNSES